LSCSGGNDVTFSGVSPVSTAALFVTTAILTNTDANEPKLNIQIDDSKSSGFINDSFA